MTTVPVRLLQIHSTLVIAVKPFNLITNHSISFRQLILDRISKGINDKVNGQAPLQKAIFKFAYDYKKIWTQRGYETPILDK